MTATDTVAPVRTSHADCAHPANKVARAACRRARAAGEPTWKPLARKDNRKGMTVRVTMDDVTVEGTLLGWGAQRLMLRDTTDKHRMFASALVRKVETTV